MAKTSTAREMEQWTKLLSSSVKLSLPYGRKAMEGCLALLAEEMQKIPPQPDRNRAKSFNGWVRGVGRFPKRFFVPLEGGGYRVKRGRKGIQRKSERSAQR